MYIVQVATELTPVAKEGGLADVIQGLSRELVRAGHTVEIILPKYDCLHKGALQDLRIESPQFVVKRGGGTLSNTLFSARVDRLKVWLIEPQGPEHFFKRRTIYGGADEIERFLYFSQAAVQALLHLGKRPDILHLHDWPTALVALLIEQLPVEARPRGVVLTIHNIHHQGQGGLDLLEKAGIALTEELKHGTEINLLKAGIEHSSQVTTVSPEYLKEMEGAKGGCGLEGVVKKHRSKICGILNGIDADFWNPSSDRYLDFHYTTEQINQGRLPQVLEGKSLVKAQLCQRMGMNPSKEIPLAAAITRLVPQKGPSLLKHALYRTLEQGGQFLLLGASPIPSIQAEFEALQKECLKGTQARIIMETDESLAHQIYAASDLFLIPSLFEPCGLTQLIALRYGSIPVARLTGGLVNTVFDIDTSPLPSAKRNGFTFDDPDTHGVNWALDRDLACYKEKRERWQSLMLQGMRDDWSWKQTTPAYLEVYRRAL